LDRLRERAELSKIAAEAAQKAYQDALHAALGTKPPAAKGWPLGKKRGPRKSKAPNAPVQVAAPVLRPGKPAKVAKVKHPWRAKALKPKPGRVIETISTPQQNPATEATE
jgi:hypothetical protein